MMYRTRVPPQRTRQDGNTLLVVLLLLLVMTLLGLASLRGAMLEERMAGSQFERNLAFQAAEAALRQGEAVALALPAPPKAAPSDYPKPTCDWQAKCYNCVAGVCGRSFYNGRRADARFENAAVAATPLPDNKLAVPKDDDVRYLVVHWGQAEGVPGCASVLDASGNVQDPLCMVDLYQVEARYQAKGRTTVSLRSMVHVPAPSSTSP